MRLFSLITVFATIAISTLNSNAQESSSSIKGIQNIKLIYASSPWNKDSTKIDTAFLFLRDTHTGKTAKIVLDETEPDSSTFSGNFSLDFANSENFRPEIYIPPQSLRDGPEGLDRFYVLLKSNKIKKKPVVLRKDGSGKQLLDVYDTNEQAERAKKVYQQELEAQKALEEKEKKLTKPVPDEATLEAEALSRKAKAMEKLALAARERELERIRLEQLERQKALAREQEAQRLSETAKAERAARAKALATEAVALFEQGKFQEAEEKFRQAVEVDPMEKSYYYSYAVTLYRNEKYNEALVAMKIAPETDENRDEKAYYTGLIHYRLNELEPALEKFRTVKASSNKDLAASSAFYEGLILYSQEEFEDSKSAFEFVLDNSNDPGLDRQAEDYIERILNAIKYREMAKKKVFLNATLGAMYDSNVTLAPDNVSSQGTALKKGSPRGLFSGGAQYRFLYTPKDEWSAKLNTVYLYSADEAVATADAAVINLSSPWVRKGLWGKKGFSWGLSPGYEVVLMDPTATGQTPFMPVILSSPMLGTDFTLIQSPKWFSSYSLEVRSDDSRLATTSADEDADALKYTLKTSQSYFLDDSKKKVIIGGLGLVLNDAKGKNKKYLRYQGNVTYVAPMKWDALWNLSLSVYQLNYGDSTTDRKDFNVTLGTGMQKPIKDWLVWGVMASYTDNSSNVETNDYSKYTIMTTATFNYSM